MPVSINTVTEIPRMVYHQVDQGGWQPDTGYHRTMKDFFELREELEQLDEKTKLARIALVGALAAGIIASGQASFVKKMEVQNYDQTYASLSVAQQKQVDKMVRFGD